MVGGSIGWRRSGGRRAASTDGCRWTDDRQAANVAGKAADESGVFVPTSRRIEGRSALADRPVRWRMIERIDAGQIRQTEGGRGGRTDTNDAAAEARMGADGVRDDGDYCCFCCICQQTVAAEAGSGR
ncbi:hypothetical protein ACLOJK_009207 [Asimina triloba]